MRRKGFTLIELLVVIVIIGILVAIALPNFIKIKDKAKEAEVKQNCHAIQLALERYAVDSPNSDYPVIIMGGDWTDSYVVWLEWVEMQENLDPDMITNPDRGGENWLPAEPDVGDPLVMESYMPSYPGNPFIKHKTDTLLPMISHHDYYGTVTDRIVGGRESNKMWEAFGPAWTIGTQSVIGDFYVHHIFNNPPYDVGDQMKDPPGGWVDPSGNPVLTGNFSYYGRQGEGGMGWPFVNARTDCVGYTLAGYGSVRTAGQDVYNRNGNYQGRFRSESCRIDCGQDAITTDVPCICDEDAPPSMDQNNGGSDTILDGVVITLDSGVDKKSGRVNVGITEGEGF